jgi:hypothetical protein
MGANGRDAGRRPDFRSMLTLNAVFSYAESEVEQMMLDVLATDCSAGACPTVFEPVDGWLVIQGLQAGDCAGAGAGSGEAPAGEGRVKISVDLLLEAADKVRARQGQQAATS